MFCRAPPRPRSPSVPTFYVSFCCFLSQPLSLLHPLPPSLSLSFPAHSCSCGFSSPLPLLLAEQQSRWVFSSCYDLRDDNGSYNVASRSWCGWACGGLCCVKVGDSLREGGGDGGGTQLLGQPGARAYLNFFYYFFLCLLVFSLLTHWLLLAPLLSFSGKLCFQYLAMFL